MAMSMSMSILKLRNLSAIRSAANSSRIGVSSSWFSKLAEGTDITSAAPGVSLQKARSWDEGVSSRFSTTPLSDIFKGAYTGVCSQQHVPSYKSHIDKFKAKGIDSVICVSVNDPYAINGWAGKLNAKDAIEFYGDCDGKFHKSLGLDKDIPPGEGRSAVDKPPGEGGSAVVKPPGEGGSAVVKPPGEGGSAVDTSGRRRRWRLR